MSFLLHLVGDVLSDNTQPTSMASKCELPVMQNLATVEIWKGISERYQEEEVKMYCFASFFKCLYDPKKGVVGLNSFLFVLSGFSRYGTKSSATQSMVLFCFLHNTRVNFKHFLSISVNRNTVILCTQVRMCSEKTKAVQLTIL